jgi:putative peptide zinc metalloprotease protein
VLVHRYDPTLEAQIRTAQARVAELEASFGVEFVNDRPHAELVREQWRAEQAALDRLLERAAALPVRAQVDGRFMPLSPEDLPGRWHKQGEVLGHVVGRAEPVVRVVVEQAEADLVGAGTRAVALRLADDPGRVIPAHILRQVPAGRDEAPSKALLASGGGKLAPDPRDPEGRRTLERVFQIDVAPDAPLGRQPAYGQRVQLRFELEPAPLALQAWRALRRLFLRHFDV